MTNGHIITGTLAAIIGVFIGAFGVQYFVEKPDAAQIEANVKERLLSDAQKEYMESLKSVFDACVEDTKRGVPSYASFGVDAQYKIDCSVATSTAQKG